MTIVIDVEVTGIVDIALRIAFAESADKVIGRRSVELPYANHIRLTRSTDKRIARCVA